MAKNLLSAQVLSSIRKVLVEKIREFCNSFFSACTSAARYELDRKNRAIHELYQIEPGTYFIR
jgi:hypothetical protein